MSMMLTEVLDLHSKSYEFQISPQEEIPAWPTKITFQATFETEQGRKYALRIFNDKPYGIHTRSIVLMLMSQKKWTQNLVVDPGTFKKVFVTMMKCYDAFKETDDGKRSGSYKLILQPGIAQNAPLIAKALQRFFKSEPKKKMYLKGANAEGKANTTELFLANQVSVYPPFGGKAYLPEYETSELFLTLSGTKGTSPSGTKPEVFAKKTVEEHAFQNVSAVLTEDGYMIDIPPSYSTVVAVFTVSYDANAIYVMVESPNNNERRLVRYSTTAKAISHNAINPVSKSDAEAVFYDSDNTNLKFSTVAIAKPTTSHKPDIVANSPMVDKATNLTSDDAKMIMQQFEYFKVKDTTPIYGDYAQISKDDILKIQMNSLSVDESAMNGKMFLFSAYVRPKTPNEAAKTVFLMLPTNKISAAIEASTKEEFYAVPSEIVENPTLTYEQQQVVVKYKYSAIKQNALVSVTYKDKPVYVGVGNKLRITEIAKPEMDPSGKYAYVLCVIESNEGQVFGATMSFPIDEIDSALYPLTKTDYESLDNDTIKKLVTGENNKLDMIKILKPTGSSTLVAGDYATVVGSFEASEPYMASKYGIPSNKVTLFSDTPCIIVTPVNHPGKYVILSKASEGSIYTYTDEVKGQVSGITSPNVSPVKEPTPPAFAIMPSDNDTSVLSMNVDYKNLVTQANAKIQLGDFNIDLVEDELDELAGKLKNIFAMFGTTAKSVPEELKKKIQYAISEVTRRQNIYADEIESAIYSAEAHLKPGTKGVSAIKQYTGSSYSSINNVLRLGEEKAKEKYGNATYKGAIDNIKSIDDVYKKHGKKFPSNLRVYRGGSITNDEIETLNNDGTYTLISYSSCSLNPTKAYSFAKFDSRHIAKGLMGDVEDSYIDKSRAGNKILMMIDRLDRCLSVYLARVSEYPTEMEMLLNRGTVLKCKSGYKVTKVVESPNTETNGWYARMSVVGQTGKPLNESIPKRVRQILESVESTHKEVLDVMDKCSLTVFVLDMLLDTIAENEADSL